MKRLISGVMLITTIMVAGSVSADSFGFYFRGNGFGVGMNFRDYDYYDRYSPGYYETNEMDFYSALSPYGRWDYMSDFGGYVWIPYVSNAWRPYTEGTWTYTDYGWTWVSYEPWGWIPHHYGRWFYHPSNNWIWIPGYTWSAANVIWSFSNGYWGWAPLPPTHCAYYSRYQNYHSRRHHGHHHDPFNRSAAHWYSNSRDYNQSEYRWIANEAWTFIPENQFVGTNAASYAVPPQKSLALAQQATQYNYSLPPKVSQIEKSAHTKITKTPVDQTFKTVSGHKIKIVNPKGVLEKRAKAAGEVQKKFHKVSTQKAPSTRKQSPINRSIPSVKTYNEKGRVKEYGSQPIQNPRNRSNNVAKKSYEIDPSKTNQNHYDVNRYNHRKENSTKTNELNRNRNATVDRGSKKPVNRNPNKKIDPRKSNKVEKMGKQSKSKETKVIDVDTIKFEKQAKNPIMRVRGKR